MKARSGCALGTRQCQQLARAAAADFGDFYAGRRPPPAAAGDVLVLECDAKGIAVRPGQLRPQAARRARQSAPKQDGRLSRGEVRTRKRMAEAGAVFDLTPVPRTIAGLLGPGPRPCSRPFTVSMKVTFTVAMRRHGEPRRAGCRAGECPTNGGTAASSDREMPSHLRRRKPSRAEKPEIGQSRRLRRRCAGAPRP